MNTIHSNDLEVSAVTLGAELQSVKGADGTEYLWQGDPAWWPRRSPLLFPIVGGLKDGKYTYDGKTYELPNHGFAKALEFALVESQPGSIVYEFKADGETLKVYPFPFVLGVAYRVSGKTLVTSYSVKNAGSGAMIFSLGAHAAFRAPHDSGEKRSDFDLVFGKKETVDRWLLGADNTRSGETIPFLQNEDTVPLDPALFDRGAIVLDKHASRSVTLKSRMSGRGVSVAFDGFPQLGIWSPKSDPAKGGECPFVCIEPWYGIMPLGTASQALESKEACVSLAAGAEWKAEYSITVG